MRLLNLAAVATTAVTLAACGKPTTENQRSFDASRQTSADATRGDLGDDQSGEEHAACLTFWLHEDHCAAGDETADDFNNPGDTPDSDGGGDATDDATDDVASDDDDVVDAPDTDEPGIPIDEPDTPSADPNVVEFRIAAGTGSQPWNTAATPVTVKVGQTLRIINDDTINHRVHTGGQPCPHQPGNMAPGQSYNCVVSNAYDGTAGGAPMYDHIVGPTARFYVKAVP